METQTKTPLAKRLWDGLRALEENVGRNPVDALEARLNVLEARLEKLERR